MTADTFSTRNLLRLATRLALGGLALLLLIEIVMWSFVRLPDHKSMTIRLHNEIPGLKKTVALTFDAQSQLRTLHWTPGEKPAGSTRILCLGGVATAGQFQNAADTWWGQLSQKLGDAAPGTKIEIGANATPATSLSLVKWAVGRLDEWKPDIIIANLGAADVFGQPVEGYRYDAQKFHALPDGPPPTPGWKRALLKVSQLARWMRIRAARSDAARTEAQIGAENYFADHLKKMRAELEKARPAPNPFRLSDADPRREYRDALKHLADAAAARSIRLVLTGEATLCGEPMTQEAESLRGMFVPYSAGSPQMVRLDSGWIERELRRFQEAAQELAAAAQIPWLDLQGEVPRDPAHFASEVILTDAGAIKAADLMLPTVLPVVQAAGGR